MKASPIPHPNPPRGIQRATTPRNTNELICTHQYLEDYLRTLWLTDRRREYITISPRRFLGVGDILPSVITVRV